MWMLSPFPAAKRGGIGLGGLQPFKVSKLGSFLFKGGGLGRSISLGRFLDISYELLPSIIPLPLFSISKSLGSSNNIH
uniref:Uncharacterized protein n=1 Tax=Picea glauca TaxID=3330 RepID=A0A101LYA9_PICGL|nr:hypothetical protein ABT39_MTgene5629 [Picea glauca]QHR88078.1 hypothetical protein Q903MT_gene2091 [Picea sitchensis]